MQNTVASLKSRNLPPPQFFGPKNVRLATLLLVALQREWGKEDNETKPEVKSCNTFLFEPSTDDNCIERTAFRKEKA